MIPIIGPISKVIMTSWCVLSALTHQYPGEAAAARLTGETIFEASLILRYRC